VKDNKKSPLKERPLHVAGQSLDEQIHSYISDDASMLLFVPGLLIAVTIVLWIHRFFPSKLLPILFSIATLIAIIYCAFRLIVLIRKIKSLILGRNGEKIVAEIFDNFRSQGFVVFHDIVAKNFNIDHVLLTTHGIFTVETKTYKKSPKGEISYKDEKIIVGNINIGNGIIIQAESESKWLKSMLKNSTGRDYHVIPVIVFPG
jgi:hypothetical protein